MHIYHIFAHTHIALSTQKRVSNRTCPKTDRNFRDLVSKATQNFDTFEDFGSNLNSDEGRKRVDKTSLDHFYDYSYRRTRKPRMPFSE